MTRLGNVITGSSDWIRAQYRELIPSRFRRTLTKVRWPTIGFYFADRRRLRALSQIAAEPLKDNGTAAVNDGAAFANLWDQDTRGRARHLLFRIMRLADGIAIPLYLFWGSLLGEVREGRILPWDDDLDLALFNPAQLELFKHALLMEGLKIHVHDTESEYWIKVFDETYPFTSDQPWIYPFVDIFIYSFNLADGDGYRSVFPITRSTILPGRRVMFEGVSCLEPARPMAILDRCYPGWRKREISSAWDHKNEVRAPAPVIRSIRTDVRGRKVGPRATP